MRIYADFNAQIDLGGPGRLGRVLLDRFGTLRDLCAARVRLRDGLSLTLYTDSDVDEDLEIEATVRWIADPSALGGGYWVGEFDPSTFRDVPASKAPSVSNWFPCSSCGAGLVAEIARAGLTSNTRCPHCGVPVQAPIAPPDDSAE